MVNLWEQIFVQALISKTCNIIVITGLFSGFPNKSHYIFSGCYPTCPDERPYFDEITMKCVPQCGCYDDKGNRYYEGGKVPSTQNCQKW